VPFYGKDAGAKLAELLRAHIVIATDIVKAAKAGDNDGVAAYDKGHEHMLMFADMLADGIVKQFPMKFSR
jgi:hypothetical protein